MLFWIAANGRNRAWIFWIFRPRGCWRAGEALFLHFVTLMSARGRASHDSEWKRGMFQPTRGDQEDNGVCELAVDIIIDSTFGLVSICVSRLMWAWMLFQCPGAWDIVQRWQESSKSASQRSPLRDHGPPTRHQCGFDGAHGVDVTLHGRTYVVG